MKVSRKKVQPIFTALMVVMILVIWINFAPVQFGGLSSYVIVAGASMEPGLKLGDLVLVQDELDYRVGDVITYQHPLIGPIIHRIIQTEGDRFVLQGDNNDWIDSYAPARDEIIGRLWLQIPNAGDVMGKLRSPTAFASLAILISIGIFSKLSSKNIKEQRELQDRSKGKFRLPPRSNAELESYIFFAAAILISSVILGLISFSKPSSVNLSQENPYELSGIFNYSAKAPTGIYDTDSVQTGDPIYLNLTKEMSVAFSFELITNDIDKADGSIMMKAVLQDPHGWNRTIELSSPRTFTGANAEASGVLDLSEIMSMIEALEEKTEFTRSDYMLTIQPLVVSQATFNGRAQLDEFSPQLTFRLDGQQMYLRSTETGVSDTAQLSTMEMRSYLHEREIPNVLTILGVDIKVMLARWVSFIGTAVSILVFSFILFIFANTTREGEAAQINFRYGGMILDIDKGMPVDDHKLVELGRIEDLARFAERAGGMILHEYRWKRHVYYVQEGDTLFRYKPKPVKQSSMQSVDQSRTNGKVGGSQQKLEFAEQVGQIVSVKSKTHLLVNKVSEVAKRLIGKLSGGSHK
jgi:signal peptidase I